MSYYQKYLKYKQKYLELKEQFGGLETSTKLISAINKGSIHIYNELNKIHKLLDESLLCTPDEKHEHSKILDQIKKLTRDIINNISLKIQNKNYELLVEIKSLYTSMLASIKNQCNAETIVTIRIKFEYITEELQKILIQ
jgi:hypothetical protein